MDVIDQIASMDPSSLIPFVKTAGFAWLIAYVTMGVVQGMKEWCKDHHTDFPTWLPTPVIAAVVGMVLVDVGLLAIGGSPLLLGRFSIIGLAAGFIAAGHYAVSNTSTGTLTGVESTLEAVSIPDNTSPVLKVVHSFLDEPPAIPSAIPPAAPVAGPNDTTTPN